MTRDQILAELTTTNERIAEMLQHWEPGLITWRTMFAATVVRLHELTLLLMRADS